MRHLGWCILAWIPKWNKLEILQCEKHQDLTLWGCKPLLVLDMWEHSYIGGLQVGEILIMEAIEKKDKIVKISLP